MNSIWLSPAKINLFLNITKKRKDGYHNIQTLFQLINYCDKIRISLNKTNKINLYPYFKKDLIIRAINYLIYEAKKKTNFSKIPELIYS